MEPVTAQTVSFLMHPAAVTHAVPERRAIFHALQRDARSIDVAVKDVVWAASRAELIAEITGTLAEFEYTATTIGLPRTIGRDETYAVTEISIVSPAQGAVVLINPARWLRVWAQRCAGHTVTLGPEVAKSRIAELAADNARRQAAETGADAAVLPGVGHWH